MINIVNKYKHAPTPADYIISRPSVLGNPFTHITTGKTLAKYVVGSRDQAVDSYEGWLMDKLRNDDRTIIKALNEIVALEEKHGSVNLICYCAPQRCHGEVIRKVIESRELKQ